MAQDKDKEAPSPPPAGDREARLAAALRANLRRRKAVRPPPSKED